MLMMMVCRIQLLLRFSSPLSKPISIEFKIHSFIQCVNGPFARHRAAESICNSICFASPIHLLYPASWTQ